MQSLPRPVLAALRPDLRVETSTDDPARPGVLIDQALGRRIRLDAASLALAQTLAARAPENHDALADAVGVDGPTLDRLLTWLDGQLLLDTANANAIADDARRTTAIAAMPADTVPLLIRDDARFTCTMCGSCCGGHNVGPVMGDVIAGLADKMADLEAATQTAKGLFFSLGGHPDDDRPADVEDSQVLCHASRGSCIFLADDRKCRIHAAYGGDAKPRACRIFPYALTATPDGIAVTIQRECRGFPEARAGKRLADDMPAIRKVLALVPQRTQTRNIVRLDAATPLTWPQYTALELQLHDIVDLDAASEIATLLALRNAVAALEPPGTDPGMMPLADAQQAIDQAVGALRGAVAQFAASIPEATDSMWVRSESLGLIDAALAALRPDFGRVLLPVARPDQRTLFRDHLHHALMGKDLAQGKTVKSALARLSFGWLVTKALAIHRAREVKRRHLVTQDVHDALVIVEFLWRHEDFGGRLLGHFDAAITGLFFDQLHALAHHGRALATPDTRIELVKF
jgi:Fe-S-cluster containining protein